LTLIARLRLSHRRGQLTVFDGRVDSWHQAGWACRVPPLLRHWQSGVPPIRMGIYSSVVQLRVSLRSPSQGDLGVSAQRGLAGDIANRSASPDRTLGMRLRGLR